MRSSVSMLTPKAFSTLSALMHRQRTGEGQFVEVPMFETMAAWLMV